MGSLNLSGDGSREAEMLLDAAEFDRVSAARRVDARFPGIEIAEMGFRIGNESVRLLHDLGAERDRLDALAAIDEFAAAGDLRQPLAGMVDPAGGIAHAVPEEILSPMAEDGVRCMEPFLGVAALDADHTFVCNNIERLTTWTLHDLVDDLSTALRCQAQVNSYVSRGSAPGFGRHWDDHDVLVTQLAGRKEWEIHQPAQIAPMRKVVPDDAAGDPIWSGVLEPGSALVIPRGWAHSVRGFALETSAHLTFSFRRAPLVEVLSMLDPESFDSSVTDLTTASLEQALGEWRSQLVSLPRQGLIEVTRLIDDGFAGAELGVRLVGGAVFAIDRCTERDLGLLANRREISLSRRTVPALAWLLEHPGSTIDQLEAGVSDRGDDLVNALAELGRAGLLRTRVVQ